MRHSINYLPQQPDRIKQLDLGRTLSGLFWDPLNHYANGVSCPDPGREGAIPSFLVPLLILAIDTYSVVEIPKLTVHLTPLNIANCDEQRRLECRAQKSQHARKVNIEKEKDKRSRERKISLT